MEYDGIWWNTGIQRLMWMERIKHFQIWTKNILFWHISYRSILPDRLAMACQNHWIELRIPCQMNERFGAQCIHTYVHFLCSKIRSNDDNNKKKRNEEWFSVFLMIEMGKRLLQTTVTFAMEFLFVQLSTDFGIKDSIQTYYMQKPKPKPAKTLVVYT